MRALRLPLTVLSLVALARAAHAQDAKPPEPLVLVEKGVERLASPAREDEEVAIAVSPALAAKDDEKKTREALAIYAHPEVRFETRLAKGKKSGAWAERPVRFPSQVQGRNASDVVTGVYYEPLKRAEGARLPAAVVLHHTGGSFEAEAILARQLAQHGIAALTIDLPNYGPRRVPGTPTGFLSAEEPERIPAGFKQAILDASRASDFLRTRPEVDPDRVGVTGISLGAIVGGSAAGIDTRFARAALVIGGGDLAKVLAQSPEAANARARAAKSGLPSDVIEQGAALVDPVTFAHRLRADDVLMINAKKDEIIPKESTLALWRRAGYPEIRWYDTGHVGIAVHLVEIMKVVREHLGAKAPAREVY